MAHPLSLRISAVVFALILVNCFLVSCFLHTFAVMKKLLPLLMAVGTLLLAAQACKEKKQADVDIITTKYVAQQPQAPIRQNVDTRVTGVEWLGRQYVVEIVRTPADSLPMVTDETGQKYLDNTIRLVVMRSDSTVFFKKRFTKNSFASYLDNDFSRRGILDNMVFHKAEGALLKFAVVVSHPEADDEFIPLEMSLDRDGGLAIRRANLLEEGDRKEE